MSKKKQVRVALRKNRQKRTRDNDLTQRYHANELAVPDPASAERVLAKGELSRHRTIVTEEPADVPAGDAVESAEGDAAARRAVDVATCLPGRVVRIHGLISVVAQ